MSILFATNDPAVIGGATNASYYDPVYVGNSTYLWDGQLSNVLSFSPSSGDDTWFHYEQRLTASGAAQDGWSTMVFDGNGAELIRFEILNGQWRMELRAGTTQYGGFYWGTTLLKTFDIKISLPGDGNIYVEWWHNHLLRQSLSTTVGTRIKPESIRFGGGDSGGHYISQVLVMESSTVNRHLAVLQPASAGNHSDWIGGFAELSDDDIYSTASSRTIGDKVTSVMDAPPVGASAVEGAIAETYRCLLIGDETPTSMATLMRVGGVDSSDTPVVLDGTGRTLTRVMDNNPVTTNPWTLSDLSSAELGLESA